VVHDLVIQELPIEGVIRELYVQRPRIQSPTLAPDHGCERYVSHAF
jgi:hypothetical protein